MVALILADSHQDGVGRYTFPSVPTLAYYALMDVSTCRRALEGLEQKGVISRTRGDRQGRGQVTFYRFVELDEPAVSAEKGRQNDSLFFDKNDAKGVQKGGISRDAYRRNENANENKKPNPPNPPVGGSARFESRDALPIDDEQRKAAERILEQICNALGIVRRRVRREILEAIELEMTKGDWPTIGTRMIAAYRELTANAHLLRCAAPGPAKFFALGTWKDSRAWPWDEQKLERQSAASVGARR